MARVLSSVSEFTALIEKAVAGVGFMVFAMRSILSQSCNNESNEPFSDAKPVSNDWTVGWSVGYMKSSQSSLG
jgi:hypothetical protein